MNPAIEIEDDERDEDKDPPPDFLLEQLYFCHPERIPNKAPEPQHRDTTPATFYAPDTVGRSNAGWTW